MFRRQVVEEEEVQAPLRSGELQAEYEALADQIEAAVLSEDEELLIRLQARLRILPVRILYAQIAEAEAEAANLQQDMEASIVEQDNLLEKRNIAREEYEHTEKLLKDKETAKRATDQEWSSVCNRNDRKRRELQDKLQQIEAMRGRLKEEARGGRPAEQTTEAEAQPRTVTRIVPHVPPDRPYSPPAPGHHEAGPGMPGRVRY
jgi:hypothetical protein